MDYCRRPCQVPEGLQPFFEVCDELHKVPLQQDQLRPDQCGIDIQHSSESACEDEAQERFRLSHNRQSVSVHTGPEEGPELI